MLVAYPPPSILVYWTDTGKLCLTLLKEPPKNKIGVPGEIVSGSSVVVAVEGVLVVEGVEVESVAVGVVVEGVSVVEGVVVELGLL